jgi:hypothetical protein
LRYGDEVDEGAHPRHALSKIGLPKRGRNASFLE